MLRKVFLDDLPRWGKGGKAKEGTINWKESVGLKVKFAYEEKEGEIKIVEYDSLKSRLKIEYEDGIYDIKTGHFSNCCLGKILNIITSEFKVNVGKRFVDFNRNIEITDRYYEDNQFIDKDDRSCIRKIKRYRYECKICGYKNGDIDEYNLLKGIGCTCCANRTVVEGINDIPTTAPWMVKYFQGGYDEAKLYSKGSIKRLKLLCPDCGRLKYTTVNQVYTNKTISCICGDGFSYPEKFIASILSQLRLDFETEYSPKWSEGKRYDFYIPEYNMIIETHGEQHYKDTSGIYIKTLKEEQANDKIKKEFALSNGIDKYIVIDMRYSEFDWAVSNCRRQLKEYFDLSLVDFNKAEEFSLSNLAKEICDYWNLKQDWETVLTIAPLFNIGGACVRNYLKRGDKLGWCKYEAKIEMKKSAKKVAGMNKRKVEVLKDGISLGIFESCVELDRKSLELFGVKFSSKGISEVCTGKIKTHKKHTFRYLS